MAGTGTRPRARDAVLGSVIALALVSNAGGVNRIRATEPGEAVAVSCSNAVEAFLLAIRDDFQRRTGHDLRIQCGLAAAVLDRVRGGGSFDAIILPPSMIDGLAGAGRVSPVGRRVLGRSPVALAQRAGSAKRSTRTIDELRGVLEASPSIAFANQGVSGQFFMSLLRRWNALDGFATRLRPMDAGPAVSAAVVKGEADLGVLPVSEIVSVPGIEVAGVFPPALDAYVVMEAAASTEQANAARVQAFLEFLASAESTRALQQHGFEAVGRPKANAPN